MLHTLEQSRSFPVIAWGVVAALSCAILLMITTLNDELTELEAERIYLESVLQEGT